MYNFPNDDPEQDRLDMFHHIIQMASDGKLFLAPVDMNGKRILDIGCGTGIWAIQMGMRAFLFSQILYRLTF